MQEVSTIPPTSHETPCLHETTANVTSRPALYARRRTQIRKRSFPDQVVREAIFARDIDLRRTIKSAKIGTTLYFNYRF